MYFYKYSTKFCPHCRLNWTEDDSLLVEYIVEMVSCRLSSRLNQDGYLNDSHGLVSLDYHGATACADCGFDLEEVAEAKCEIHIQLWIVKYFSTDQTCIWPLWQEECPDRKEIEAELDNFEPDRGEFVEILGPFALPGKLIQLEYMMGP